MSAYIMNEDEINTIVSYFIDPNHIHGEGAWLHIGDNYDYLNANNSAEVAKILMDANVKSVNERYNDDTVHEYEFEYLPQARKRPIGNIIGALDCYEYQACEAGDWNESNALEIVQGLRKHLLKTIAEKDGTYTWGIK